MTAGKLPDGLGKAKALAAIAAALAKTSGEQEFGRHLQALSETAEPLVPTPVSLSLLPHDDHVLKAMRNLCPKTWA